jgi:SAM-dependent methyltransferase
MEPYYRDDLALIHHRGFGFHADRTAPGILKLLEPVRGGVVLEIGCGSGLLTRHLIDAGHTVIGSDASPAMLAVARSTLGSDADLRQIALPDDPLPEADAIVSVGHPISYLSSADAIWRALAAMATALRPGGLLAIDICDLSWGAARRDALPAARSGEDWAIITEFSVPSPDKFIRDITTFVPAGLPGGGSAAGSGDGGSAGGGSAGGGLWRREREHHENTLLDTAKIPPFLAGHGLTATVGTSFGGESLPEGLHTVIARKPAAASG